MFFSFAILGSTLYGSSIFFTNVGGWQWYIKEYKLLNPSVLTNSSEYKVPSGLRNCVCRFAGTDPDL
jgi:hypothetical protein